MGMIEHYDTTAGVDSDQFAAVSAPRGRTDLKQQQKIDLLMLTTFSERELVRYSAVARPAVVCLCL